MHINSRHEPIDLTIFGIETSTHEEILYYYNNHLCNTFSNKKLTQIILTFAYNSNITDNITVQCNLCAKRLHGQ